MKRAGFVGLLALVVGASGCAGTSMRDGALMSRSKAWAPAPAPAQVQVTPMPAVRGDADVLAKSDSRGLSKYFPTLRKGTAEPTTLASTTYRPSWFGLRKPKALAPTQTYMTDARAGLNRAPAEPSLLPVALRVPTDPSVTPTSAEGVAPASAPTPGPLAAEARKPYDEDVNPLPPAAEPEVVKVVNRMPEVPAVDPTDEATTPPGPAVSAEVAKEDRTEPAEIAPAAKPEAKVAATSPVADPKNSLGLPAPAVPVSYTRRDTMPAPAHTHHFGSKSSPVLASPQVAVPTVKVKPSPQASAQSPAAAKKWQRPCLRRLIRKKWKLGEYATPPTAAPH